MIENIGLSYNNAMDSVNSSRFKKWTASLKITELKGENRQALWSVTFQKNGQKPEIFQFQHSVWQVIFSNLGGYEYTILPTRKLASWLSSISVNKVSPKVKPVLERYQDECDDVLHEWFFGAIAQRKNSLIEKAEIGHKILELEKKLEENEDYKELMNLKTTEMRLGKTLKGFDRQVVIAQRTLWDQDFVTNNNNKNHEL
jgi:hypothetical protein